jgi:YD repeat-containing protein
MKQIRLFFFYVFSIVCLNLAYCPLSEAEEEPSQTLETVEVTDRYRPRYGLPSPGSGGRRSNDASVSNRAVPLGAVVVIGKRPAKDGNTDEENQDVSPSTCLPVIIATGEKHFRETDFVHYGEHPLSLTRKYRSQSTRGRLFGPQWHSSLDYPKLEFSGCTSGSAYGFYGGCYPTAVIVTLPDGASYSFKRNGVSPIFFPEFVTSGDSGMGYLQIFGATATMFIGERQFKYNSYSKLIQSIDDSGRTIYSFNYSGETLNSIANSGGETVQFQYGINGLVSKVIAPDGSPWIYEYDNAAAGIKKVVPPLKSGGSVRSYEYTKWSSNPFVASSVIKGVYVDGVQIKNVTYDSVGRVETSGDGESTDRFAYGTNWTTVTNQRGESITYNFRLWENTKQLISTNRAASASCAATAASQEYDGNGFVSVSTDFNGNRTEYTTSPSGQLLKRIDNVGTPSQLTTENQFDRFKLIETKFIGANGQAFRKINYFFSSSGLAASYPSQVVESDLLTGSQRTVTYGYTFHANGNLSVLTETRNGGGLSQATSFAYNQLGNIVSITNAKGQTTSITQYDQLGRPKRFISAAGVTNFFQYDALGNTIKRYLLLESGSRTSNFTYDGERRLVEARFANGAARLVQYNSAGRVTNIGDAAGYWSRHYLDVGNANYVDVSDRHTPNVWGTAPTANGAPEFYSRTQLNSRGDLWKSGGASGQEIAYTYDGNGNVKTKSDAAGRVTYFDYNSGCQS